MKEQLAAQTKAVYRAAAALQLYTAGQLEAGRAPGLRSMFDPSTSGAEQIAAWAPRAKVVKAFNTTGAENMAAPVYDGQASTMFICGDDEMAKAAAAQLAEELAFEVIDVGGLSAARHLENLALLWIHLARVSGLGRDIAFRLMRR